MNKRKFVLIGIIIGLIFISCTNLLSPDAHYQQSADTSTAIDSGTSGDGKTYISVAINEAMEKTALPQLTSRDSFTYLLLKGKKSGSTEDSILGAWTSDDSSSAYSKMVADSVAVEPGIWSFNLRAAKDGIVAYEANIKDVTLSNGSIKLLSFSLGRSDIILLGTGRINITLNYQNSSEQNNIQKVYALCEQNYGNAPRERSMTNITFPSSNGQYVFDTNTEQVPAGVYCVTFFFYSDNETRSADDSSNWWKNCIGYWREYAIVAGGLESSSTNTITSVGSLYHISFYESDDTTQVTPHPFSGTYPTTFTRHSSDIMLPVSKEAYDNAIEEIDNSEEFDNSAQATAEKNKRKSQYSYVEKSGYVFDGWYKNKDLSGDVIEKIPAESTSDYKLYAKWLKKWNLTYHIGTTTSTLSLVQSVSYNLYDTIDLKNMSGYTFPSGKVLLGWTTNSNGGIVAEKGFESGAEYTPVANLELYAVFADVPSSTIPVISSTVTDETLRATYQNVVINLAKTENAFLNKNYGTYKDYVVTTDSDADGLYDWEEVFVTNTNPWNRDTDGDGWDDKTELTTFNKQTNTFNPLIADLPRLNVSIESAPYFTYTYTTTNGKSMSDSITRTETGAISHTTNRSQAESYSSSYNLSINGTYGNKFNASAPGWETSYSISAGFTKGWTLGDTYTFSRGESETYTKSVANGRVNTSNESRTVTGGTVKIAVKFENPGDIAYTINNVAVEAFRKQSGVLDSKPFYVPLGSMKSGSSVAMTLQPHSTSGIINYELNLTNQQFEDLMRNTSALDVVIAGYSINMKDTLKRSSDFTDAYTNVDQLTSHVVIDYGPSYPIRKPEVYNVAVKTKPRISNSTATIDVYDDVTLEDILKICVGEGNFVIENGRLKKVYGLENSSVERDGSWYVDYRFTDGAQQEKKLSIVGPASNDNETLDQLGAIGAKSSFRIFYDVDNDGDGVPLRIEKEFGSSDKSVDSDGDGITDKEEIFGWIPSQKTGRNWKTATGTHATVFSEKIRTRPNLADSDGDGWSDGEDANPIVARDLTDSTLKELTCSFGAGKKSIDVKIVERKSSDNNYDLGKVLATSAKIWIAPKATLVASNVTYAIVEQLTTEVPSIPADSEFRAVPNWGIDLKRKRSVIFIKVRAPDNETTSIYRLPVDSPYCDISNLTSAQSPREWDLSFDASFDAYEDPRKGNGTATSVNYVLYASTTSVPTTISGSDVANLSSRNLDTATLSTDFKVEIPADNMKAGKFSVRGFKQNTKYKIAVFAYSSTGSDFYANRIYYKEDVNFGLARKGKIKVYLNWMRLAWDPNALGKPEYIWLFKLTETNGELLRNGKLSEVTSDFSRSLNMGRYNWSSFSEDQFRYGHASGSECSPKTYELEFDQYENREIRLKKNLMYETAAGRDQPLTQSDYVIKYDKSSKKWTITTDCQYYKSGERYQPGTNPLEKSGDKYSYSSYEVSTNLTSPGVKKDLETYYSACSSDSWSRWEYGGLIVNVSFEWME